MLTAYSRLQSFLVPVATIGSRNHLPVKLVHVPSFRNFAAFFGRGQAPPVALATLPALGGRVPSGQAWCQMGVWLVFSRCLRRLSVKNAILSGGPSLLAALPASFCSAYLPHGLHKAVLATAPGTGFTADLWVREPLQKGFYSMTGNFSHHVISELANWWFQQRGSQYNLS